MEKKIQLDVWTGKCPAGLEKPSWDLDCGYCPQSEAGQKTDCAEDNGALPSKQGAQARVPAPKCKGCAQPSHS